MPTSEAGDDLRIALTFPYSIREITGVGTVVRGISAGLVQSGDDFLWVVPSGSGSPLLEVPKPARVREVDLRKLRVMRNLALGLRTFWFLATHRPRIDLVHAHTPHPQSVAAIFAARLLGVPSVATFHGVLPLPRDRVRAAVLSVVEHWIVKNASAVTTVSDSTRVDLGILRAQVIKNGVRVPAALKQKKEPFAETLDLGNSLVVAYSGRFAPLKGLDVLFSAFHALLAEFGYRLRLLLIGSGLPEEVQWLRGLLSTLDLEAFVTVVDAESNYQRYLSVAHLYVLPSLREGLPLTLLDAMASGLACIATKVGGIPEAIDDGIDGILIPPADLEALTSSMRSLLLNPGMRTNLGDRAREKIAREFGEEAMSRKYIQLYRELLGRDEVPA